MFSWIQLSDLHFQDNNKNENYIMGEVRDNLLSYIRDLKKNNHYSALLLAGDYRFAKNSKGDPTIIAKYIKDIAQNAGIEEKNIICAPGNHDLDRGVIRTAIIDSVGKNYDNGALNSEVRESLESDFAFFSNLEKELYGIDEPSSFPRIVETEGLNILVLNTALTSGRDEERGTLIIGQAEVKSALEQINKEKPVIALGHHGASFWDREESKEIFHIFENYKINLYLCGHEHSLYSESCGTNVLQISTGCIFGESSEAQIGFATGSFDGRQAKIQFHEWNRSIKNWNEIKPKKQPEATLYSLASNKQKRSSRNKNQLQLPKKYNGIQQKKYEFTLNGHVLIGSRGKDGIKYYWRKGEEYVESLAFNRRVNERTNNPKTDLEDDTISAYTVSTSFGCLLSVSQKQCRFCATGSRPFTGLLSSEEIAMQSIFMTTYDSACPSFPEVKNHKREISFMGQGEPGFNYSAIREAIKIIDCAMAATDQKIYRYVISTCGVCDFMPALIQDIKNHTFMNPVSLHFSLHAIDELRNRIMPINMDYDYKEFINYCKTLYELTNTKIGVGILMFKNFIPIKRVGEAEASPITLNSSLLREILNVLDPDVFRIDLCDLNKTKTMQKKSSMSNEEAHELLAITQEMGFEAKIFSSFGADINSGCGMLFSDLSNIEEDGQGTLEMYRKSLDLLHYAINELRDEG